MIFPDKLKNDVCLSCFLKDKVTPKIVVLPPCWRIEGWSFVVQDIYFWSLTAEQHRSILQKSEEAGNFVFEKTLFKLLAHSHVKTGRYSEEISFKKGCK